MTQAREQLRGFVGGLLRRKGDLAEFGDEDALIASGRLDSVEIIEIVAFMEERFGVDFVEVEFNRDDFESVSTMLGVVRSAKSKAA